jgi:sugar transferase (PEP-CTERM/EpsH1 system associated)
VPYAPTRIRTRPYHLIRTLGALGHRVTLATTWNGDEERRALDALASDVEQILAEPVTMARSLWNCVSALPSGEPLQARYSWHPALARRLDETLVERPFDVVHVEHLRGARYGLHAAKTLARGGRPTPVVWDSVDCISDLFRRAAAEGRRRHVRLAARLELPRTERYEGAVAPRFARVLVTSDADRDGLLRLAGHTPPTSRGVTLGDRLEVLPNGVALDYFTPNGTPRDEATLVITGKMSYHANVSAVVGFVEEVLPRVWAHRPGVRLEVVGKDPTPDVQRLAGDPRVVVTGTVDDVRPFLRRATLAIAPIRYGVGVQNKVLEAMACAAPVVATRQAVGSLGATPGRDLAVADRPGELAETVLTLLADAERRTAVGCAGRRFVERHHDWRAVARRLAQIYREAGG